jgi:hypothetical protein
MTRPVLYISIAIVAALFLGFLFDRKGSIQSAPPVTPPQSTRASDPARDTTASLPVPPAPAPAQKPTAKEKPPTPNRALKRALQEQARKQDTPPPPVAPSIDPKPAPTAPHSEPDASAPPAVPTFPPGATVTVEEPQAPRQPQPDPVANADPASPPATGPTTGEPAPQAAELASGPDSPDGARRIQGRLAELGYLPPAGADGIWGRRSQAALAALRRNAGLGNDALWDARTEQVLFAANAPRQKPQVTRKPKPQVTRKPTPSERSPFERGLFGN